MTDTYSPLSCEKNTFISIGVRVYDLQKAKGSRPRCEDGREADTAGLEDMQGRYTRPVHNKSPAMKKGL